MKLIRAKSKALEFLTRRKSESRKREKIVRKIIEDVKSRGDRALSFYTRKFDGVKVPPHSFLVREREISAAFNEINSEVIYALKAAIENVTSFYRKQIPRNIKIKTNEGKVLEERFIPLESVGVYVPAGRMPLVSSVYMSVVPAKVAGVKRIVLATPPTSQGFVNSYILAVASLLKVKEVYKIGGAQAIAALAYGTESVRPVDKIVGAGNEYVTEAKRQVFGRVGIDMLAGPTEVVIVAGRKSNYEYIVKDLEAQIEHGKGAVGIVVSLSKSLTKKLRQLNINNGYVVPAKNIEGAAQVVNALAPEHLEVMIGNVAKFMKMLRHSGTVFIGSYSPTALGDYTAGPSHILPTSSSARFFSGLSVYDFFKRVNVVKYSRRALLKEAGFLEKIASLEGARRHAESVKIRLKS